MQTEIQEGDQSAKSVEDTRHIGSADDFEKDFRPISVIELQRHAGDNQKQETGDDKEVQESIEGQESGKPFLIFLRMNPGFSETFGIIEEQVD